MSTIHGLQRLNDRTRVWLIVAVLLAVIAAAALAGARRAGAQTGGGYDLTWNTIDGGGTTSLGKGYRVTGTIGQPDAYPPLTGGGFTLTGGFWPGMPALPLHGTYLPLLRK